MVKILKAGKKRITIKCSNEMKWCKVVLKTENGSVILGAEVLYIIKERFNKLFVAENNLKKIGEHDGRDLFWLISFSENHCTIFMALLDNGLRFYFQDKEGCIFDSLDVSEDELEDWKVVLKE